MRPLARHALRESPFGVVFGDFFAGALIRGFGRAANAGIRVQSPVT